MTPPRTEFMAGLAAERDKRIKERCVKRKAARQLYRTYRCEIFSRTVAQRKGER